MEIKIVNLNLRFTKEYYALCNVNIDIPTGYKMCLLGEKDSGKTSLLRVIAGLEKDYEGEVFFNDKELKTLSYKYDINLGYLPLKGVFFEGKTLFQNLKYALEVRSTKSPYEIEELINSTLEKFNLQEYKDTKMRNLSYFLRLKSAIARMSIRKIDILLIDNIVPMLKKDELLEIKNILLDNFFNENTTCIFAMEDESLAQDFNLNIINMHAGIIN